MLGDLAEEHFNEALEIYDRFGQRPGRCQILNDLGAVHLTRIRVSALNDRLNPLELLDFASAARNYFEQSLKLARDLGLPAQIAQAEQNLAVLEKLPFCS